MALMSWCALNAAQYPCLSRITHIPNGGFRDIREGAKFKSIGVRKGFPDYFLPVVKPNWQPNGSYHGLFIEMKVGTNKTTPEQNDWLDYLSSAGYKCHVCYGWIEARDRIMEYLSYSAVKAGGINGNARGQYHGV